MLAIGRDSDGSRIGDVGCEDGVDGDNDGGDGSHRTDGVDGGFLTLLIRFEDPAITSLIGSATALQYARALGARTDAHGHAQTRSRESTSRPWRKLAGGPRKAAEDPVCLNQTEEG